ncbi:MAG: RecX family transcriptional regulator [Burkholderiales bacterium]
MVGPKRSLKARALQYLAQREQSRLELRRKLLSHAQGEEAAANAACNSEAGADRTAVSGSSAAERVDAVLDWLVAHDYLSAERFVESRVHARAPRFGNLRIRHELKQHAVLLPAHEAQALKESELARACAVRARKFPQPPSNASEQARQMRFLIGRGFSPEVIRRALRDAGTDTHEATLSAD